MARLNKAQKEARDGRRTAVAAQIAADAQTTSSTSALTAEVPPTPASSALSTNQPLVQTPTSTGIITDGPSVITPRRSPSIISESGVGPPSISASSAVALGNIEASGSKSPLGGPPSDMSTSDESDNDDAGKDKSIVNDTAQDASETAADEDDELGGSASGASPEVRCMWEDCGRVFTTLAPFITHLHEDHVGIHKARYACEWTGCPRKGKMQTSRFALLSHLRSHTGEKPFTCPRPECDKSFTRSDALAKHMRVQHNINPVSNRGRGSRGGGGSTINTDSVNNSGGRSSRARATGDDDDAELLGEDSVDVVGDELLELAEGDGNTSLADIESSLAFQGATGYAYTYDNLFGSGSNALADFTGATNYTESDLGIVRDRVPPSGPLVDDNMPDEIDFRREEDEMGRILETGRRMWIEREKERAKLRIVDEDITSEKRVAADYDSDDMSKDESLFKRSRQSQGGIAVRLDSPASISTARISGRSSELSMEGNRLKKLYLIEKAKLRVIQSENKKMRLYLDHLREMEREEKLGKRQALERALEAELGRDVAAIFSPPPSPTHDV